MASVDILHDFSPLIRVHKDGRVERFMGLETVPPSLDQETNILSKDVVISPDTNLSARLYIPNDAKKTTGEITKLPLIVYFHGGGFVAESAFSPLYHNHLNHLVSHARAVTVSVNYRLAPENPLPAAYEDSRKALQWVLSSEDDWIRDFADLENVYLGGDSSGGNIAHNAARRFGTEKIDGIRLRGLFLNCPFFGGEVAIGNEETHPQYTKSFVDKLWRFACPDTIGCDDPALNPEKDTELSSLGCEKVIVFVGETDMLAARGLLYEVVLKKSGWVGKIEVVEAKGEGHLYSIFDPKGDNGVAMLKKVASFINH